VVSAYLEVVGFGEVGSVKGDAEAKGGQRGLVGWSGVRRN
jgi:hypothetical protein